MKHKAENYFGWYGVLAILLAYLLVSFNVVTAKSLGYQVLNLSGALGIVAEAWSKKDAQPALLNGVWATIAVVAIIRLVA
jgi:hypothetical protein